MSPKIRKQVKTAISALEVAIDVYDAGSEKHGESESDIQDAIAGCVESMSALRVVKNDKQAAQALAYARSLIEEAKYVAEGYGEKKLASQLAKALSQITTASRAMGRKKAESLVAAVLKKLRK